MPIISTNDILTHRELKSKSAILGSTLGKMVDHYCKVGMTLGLERINLENLSEDELAKLRGLIEHFSNITEGV